MTSLRKARANAVLQVIIRDFRGRAYLDKTASHAIQRWTGLTRGQVDRAISDLKKLEMVSVFADGGYVAVEVAQ